MKPRAYDRDEVKERVNKLSLKLFLPYFLLVCLLTPLVIYLILRVRRKRRYRALAQKLGLTYTYCAWPEDDDGPLLSSRSEWVTVGKHRISGTIDHIKVGICDGNILENMSNDDPSLRKVNTDTAYYHKGTASSTTAVIMRMPGLELPDFVIWPRDKSEDWLKGDAGIKEFADIELVDNNRIMGDYSLSSSNALTSEFQALLRHNSTMSVHGENNILVLSRYMLKMSFDEIEKAVELGKKLVIALLPDENRDGNANRTDY